MPHLRTPCRTRLPSCLHAVLHPSAARMPHLPCLSCRVRSTPRPSVQLGQADLASWPELTSCHTPADLGQPPRTRPVSSIQRPASRAGPAQAEVLPSATRRPAYPRVPSLGRAPCLPADLARADPGTPRPSSLLGPGSLPALPRPALELAARSASAHDQSSTIRAVWATHGRTARTSCGQTV